MTIYTHPGVYIGPLLGPPGSAQDMAALKANLGKLYEEALEEYKYQAATPSVIKAIREKLVEVNLSVCWAAGLRSEDLTLQTNVEIGSEGTLHLTIVPEGSKVQEFEMAAAPVFLPVALRPPPVASEPLSWDGWPLGAPEDE